MRRFKWLEKNGYRNESLDLLECLDNTISNEGDSKEELIQKIDMLERESEELKEEIENEEE